jgi:hypothetical protein
MRSIKRWVFFDPGLADIILQGNELHLGCEGHRGGERKQRSGESRHHGHIESQF